MRPTHLMYLSASSLPTSVFSAAGAALPAEPVTAPAEPVFSTGAGGSLFSSAFFFEQPTKLRASTTPSDRFFMRRTISADTAAQDPEGRSHARPFGRRERGPQQRRPGTAIEARLARGDRRIVEADRVEQDHLLVEQILEHPV